MFFFFGPLGQFDISFGAMTGFLDFNFFFLLSDFDFSLFLALIFIFLWQISDFFFTNSKNGGLQSEDVVEFDLEAVMKDIINKKNFPFLLLISFYFLFIFFSNITGLIPYTQTLTSQLVTTLFLSISSVLIIWFYSFFVNKIFMFNHFLPNGAPLIITPFIILIELISNFSRIISLAVRVFANMTSGHALLKILASFAVGAISIFSIWSWLAIFPILLIFIISVLELLIAFLQTYVFITLLLIAISEQE